MEWKQSLETLGYAILPCLNELEVAYGLSLFEQWWDSNLARAPVSPHGVIKHYQVGHTGFAWWCRTKPFLKQFGKPMT